MIKIRIAVLTDIHGNNVALEEVLKDARENNIDEYIVLGDLITDFPQGNEVINTIKNITPYVIKGNREEYMLNYEKTKYDDIWKHLQYSNFVNFYNSISKENMEYIRKLPNTLSLNFDGLKIKAEHGARNDKNGCICRKDTEQINRVFNEFDENILVYGHVHENVNYIKRDNKIILHAGVVGMHNNNGNKPEYAIIEYNKNKEISIIRRIVKYDIEKLKQVLLRSSILELNRTWTNLSYYCIKTGQDIRTSFVEEGIKMMNEKYKGNKQEGIDLNFNVIDDDIYEELSKKYEKYFLLK